MVAFSKIRKRAAHIHFTLENPADMFFYWDGEKGKLYALDLHGELRPYNGGSGIIDTAEAKIIPADRFADIQQSRRSSAGKAVVY